MRARCCVLGPERWSGVGLPGCPWRVGWHSARVGVLALTKISGFDEDFGLGRV